MSKVLFIGHYREGTGWATAAQNYILALDSQNVDVVCRAVKLGMPNTNLPERIVELENKSAYGCDVVIQHILPHHYVAGDFKSNICIFDSETHNFKRSGWSNYINLMDRAIVPYSGGVSDAYNSGVKIPVSVVPHCINISKFQERRNELDLGTSDFLFLTVGESTPRKNLPALIRAFHSEFDPSEPVNLVIKTNSPNFSEGDLKEEVIGLCNKIKENLRLYPSLSDYKQEIVITQYLQENILLDLYHRCDSFVSTSYGEGFNLPLLDAVGMGKYPICSDTTAHKDLVDYTVGTLVECHPTIVSGVKGTFPNLHTGFDEWDNISVPALKVAMRKTYNSMKSNESKLRVKYASMRKVVNFSHQVVGKKMKELLG